MDKQIKVERRNVYGVTKYYPVCDNAKLFARIARTITLTPEALKHAQSLGFLLTLVILSKENLHGL
jgi:hypothetical protein